MHGGGDDDRRAQQRRGAHSVTARKLLPDQTSGQGEQRQACQAVLQRIEQCFHKADGTTRAPKRKTIVAMPPRPAFVDFVMERFSPAGEITARFMMGGWCLYCDGLTFALVADNEVYLKGGDSNIPEFEARGLKAFRPFPDQDLVMKYYQAPPEVFEDPDAMRHWVGGAVAVARMKARKSPRKKPAAKRAQARKR